MVSRVVKHDMDISRWLPEAVFSNIITWLPIKEAVRTSLLMKLWRYDWKHVTRLDLDPESMSIPNVENVGRDSNANELNTKHSSDGLFRCTSLFTSIIQSIEHELVHCQVVHFPVNMQNGQFIEWVDLLVNSKQVKNLILRCLTKCAMDAQILGLPPGIFSALERLELTCYLLLDVSLFQSSKKLRILKLTKMMIGEQVISGIFSFCVNLEEFCLRGCYGFTTLKTSSQSLKFLELHDMCIPKINISAEGLTTLILDKISFRWSCVVINAPKVVEFHAHCAYDTIKTVGLLERFTGFLSCHEGSSHMGYLSPFENLKVLCATLDLNNIRHAILLSYIFRVCSRLEKLGITAGVRYRGNDGKLYYPEHLFWEKKEVADCISNCLRVVSVQNYMGKVLEMELVKYLITKAPRLHRIVVKYDDDCKTEDITAAMSLLSLPRASVDLSVVIEPQNSALACGEEVYRERDRNFLAGA